ncbi:hypothetical protein PF007_g11033 [Phytophthora fragariae]|uniref:Uncharacterized protein n=3 Tax=Phytophthora fragariae TaxID=53985 RepID=A0A6A3SFP8_9STRA|nr:hypothetical protein PF009_g13641 [Phytophthora fragariae]KAE9112593.1 hypothetical protein PF007_g11033 [Phytophthora fragariae]
MGHMAEARVLNPNISATTEAFGGHMAEARVLNPDISATTEAFGAYKVSATTQMETVSKGDYSPGYERRRREKKKAEKEALKTQVQQYEVQLELLRLRQPIRQNLLTQNSDLAERAQSVLSNRHSCAPSAPLATFPTLGAIASR